MNKPYQVLTKKKNPKEDIVMTNTNQQSILNPAAPRQIAEIVIDELFRINGIRALQYVSTQEAFYLWKDGCYSQYHERLLQEDISFFLTRSLRNKGTNDEPLYLPILTRSQIEREILSQLKNICSKGIAYDLEEIPSWLFNVTDEALPNPLTIIPFKNKLLSVDNFLKNCNPFECLLEITPKYFSPNLIPFDIDPNDYGRLLPVKFLAFLDDVLNNDEETIGVVQEMMGYCLTNLTKFQKAFLFVGPTRSGKGTICRMLRTMLGKNNVVSPTTNSMGESFGMQAWLNKRLAILNDVRFGDKLDKETIKERLLAITGEDDVTVQRKFKESLTVKLPAKIIICSNELPTFRDAGLALVNRFIVFHMTKSYLHKEDTDLFERDLQPEIPKVFWWALQGLQRLLQRGKFIQPESGREKFEEMDRFQAPIKAFVTDMCNVGYEYEINKHVLFNAYETWCKEEGIKPEAGVSWFLRNLKSAFPHIKDKRPFGDGFRPRLVVGLNLKDRS